MRIRRPSVAGAFYPSQPDKLKQVIKDCFLHKLGPGKLPIKKNNDRSITSVVCPHAGYIYSGPAAAHCYFNLAEEKQPDTTVILGPNHRGWGSPISMMGEGAWETPLGKIMIDEKTAKKIFNSSNIIDFDETAHVSEHSIEVQLPFLQYVFEDFKFIPISMGYQDLETCIEIGETIAKIAKGQDILIIASSDLSHQESQEVAIKKDRLVIDAVLEMNEIKLQEKVLSNRITTCGYGPISVAIISSKILGSKKSELLSYYTSGDIIGDYRGVVGYASLKISK
jgi:AmmeMemoRadiSam system protein B